ASLLHLQRITTAAFHMRRKTLRNNLKKWIDDATFERLEINSERRPEQIRVDQYVALADALFEQDKTHQLK
ncbi:MAG: 16S rRNA (adenine(1518)-N(6)/adenine(1519)-N(6))-dimethyltransferase, partial [Shewanellaceae bacterium]|nr:16S rRNA (adenine(1518)-N(6)/adenine(1519)-N(6))-dimethyltransferase [Shewanellaceae bacterium]